jgi:hypothetical protein
MESFIASPEKYQPARIKRDSSGRNNKQPDAAPHREARHFDCLY